MTPKVALSKNKTFLRQQKSETRSPRWSSADWTISFTIAPPRPRSDRFPVVPAWVFFPLIILYAAATHALAFKWTALWGSLAVVFVFIGFYDFFRHAERWRRKAANPSCGCCWRRSRLEPLHEEPFDARKAAGLAAAFALLGVFAAS